MKLQSGLCLFVAVLVAGLATAANAASTAHVVVRTSHAIPLEIDDKSDLYCAGFDFCTAGPLTGPGWEISVFVELNPDPNIDYSFNVQNNTGGALPGSAPPVLFWTLNE